MKMMDLPMIFVYVTKGKVFSKNSFWINPVKWDVLLLQA